MKGTPQGGVVSPLLANVFLHLAFDDWMRQTHPGVPFERYADDIVAHCTTEEQAQQVMESITRRIERCRLAVHPENVLRAPGGETPPGDSPHRRVSAPGDAERFLAELRARVAKFGLELHPEKTRLLEFGPFAAERRQRVGKGKPETFNFLGFTHICGKKRNGRFTVVRQTIRGRWQAKLGEVKAELRRRMHDPTPQVGAWLGAVVRGHVQYYGVPMNGPAITRFRCLVGRLWHRALARRSHTGHVSWERMRRLVERWLPPARICHPYPLRRLGVVTWGRSRMR
jgi:hypothetical protein